MYPELPVIFKLVEQGGRVGSRGRREGGSGAREVEEEVVGVENAAGALVCGAAPAARAGPHG